MIRSAAIIVEDGAIALLRRERLGETYYLFPGGPVEDGETEVETVLRAVREDLGLKVEVGRLVAEVVYRGDVQHYFQAFVTGRRSGTGTGSELRARPSEDASLAGWVRVSEVLKIALYPPELARLVVGSFYRGWPAGVVQVGEQRRKAA
jgi:8-oxo-dGTP diphosphatase